MFIMFVVFHYYLIANHLLCLILKLKFIMGMHVHVGISSIYDIQHYTHRNKLYIWYSALPIVLGTQGDSSNVSFMDKRKTTVIYQYVSVFGCVLEYVT